MLCILWSYSLDDSVHCLSSTNNPMPKTLIKRAVWREIDLPFSRPESYENGNTVGFEISIVSMASLFHKKPDWCQFSCSNKTRIGAKRAIRGK